MKSDGYADPASARSNKSRAMKDMAMLTECEKAEQRVYRSFDVIKKVVDGNVKLVYSMSGTGYISPITSGSKEPQLPREYTSYSAFKAALLEQLEAIKNGLGDTES